ncbi:CamS family sex pheromone protein [Lysinibacillus xylanilyticus]|uniref:CamS family sex pheromone protein n=1 Tax=Lysinibacillus xylanilyticus TaxID=582475 RepID=UPI002B24F0A3|nr:CamS family sex pheromone protein [Lysinibacillus xylanilyticus]MEB2302112.1 CamS family sex pheromone protein [Lysinibacillus xylanilyticus]
MNIKKSMLFFVLPLLLLASCSDDNEVNKNDEKIYASSIQQKEIYEIKQPAKTNVSRGLILSNMNNTLNVIEIEKGLMDLSINHFPTKKFSIQEGQYLDEKMIHQWLDRKSKEGLGLNPSITKSTGDVLEDEKNNPKILSHVLEQNFVNKENGKVEGISLAISLNEFYDIRVHDDKGLTYTDQVKVDTNEDNVNDVENYGKEIAEAIVKNIRNNNKMPNVPIYLTLYQESNKNDIIPGIFLAETFIPEGEVKIDKWNDIDIKNYTFPSDSLNNLDKDTYDKLLIFKEDIQEGFKHLNPKLIGKLQYKNGKLIDLKIDVHAPLINDTELIGLLQLTSTKLSTILFNYIPITIRIIDQNHDVGVVLWDPTSKQIYVNTF